MDYNVEWAQETKRMIELEGGISEVVQTDVTDEESCKNAVSKTVELFGTVNILVNIGRLLFQCDTMCIEINVCAVQSGLVVPWEMLPKLISVHGSATSKSMSPAWY